MNKQASRAAAVRLWLLLGAAAVWLAGCGSAAESAKHQLNPSAESPIDLEIADAAVYNDALALQRGKVVLVDFWAIWCPTCIKQFPHTADLFQQHRDQGLAVISVSLDQPKAEPQVRAFLQKNRASFKNLLSGYKSSMAATEAFNLPGPIPCYRVYDRSGKLRHEFGVDPQAERQYTIDDIEAAVVALL